MSKVSEKLGYIHGMMDGLKLNKDDDTVKILGMIVEVLDDASSSIAQLENDQQELNDYVESIDDDLADLEMQHKEDGDDFDDIEDDDDFDIITDEAPARRERAKLSVLPRKNSEERSDDDDADEEQDEETDLYIGCVCPKCGKFFAVCNPDDYEDDQKFECPFCHSHVSIEPMKSESVPTAKPVED